MSYLRIRYDLVADYGQILLAVLSFLIATMYKQSQNCVMKSDWWMAFVYRRFLQRAVVCFSVMSILVLAAVVVAAIESKKSLMNGSGISTLLVAVLTVSFVDGNEPCRLEDIFDMYTNNINVALITSLLETNEKSLIVRSVWQAVRRVGKALAETRKFVWFPHDHTLYPYLNRVGENFDDVIESLRTPPLQLKITDYPLVAAMVRLYKWKIVCVCETSYKEISATIRLLQREYKDFSVPSTDGRLLSCFSEFLALAENPKNRVTAISKQHLEELHQFRERNALENEFDVVVQWICNSPFLLDELRSWDNEFKTDVQDMLSVCPTSSGYRGVVEKLAKVNDAEKLELLYKELITEEPLKAVFILFALKSYREHVAVHGLTQLRARFMSNCKQYVSLFKSQPELRAILSTESSRDLAYIAMLMFLRVGQGYDQ
jgi:hypothetical protein